MTAYFNRYVTLAGAAALFAAGCGQTNFPDALDTTLTDTNRIISDADLAPNEKRQQLAALGIPDLTINLLLRAERLANQFGGTLESAFNRVINDQFSQMTPDEIQLYGDATAETTFSDQQAFDLSKFFVNNSLNSAQQLEDYLDTPGNEFPSSLNADEVRAVFVDFDPNEVLDDLP